MKKGFPYNSKHQPIIAVDYSKLDSSAGDAKYLSIGEAQWSHSGHDYSAKVFRLLDEDKDSERWARNSEELPLWRVLDLAILLISQITGRHSYLNEFHVDGITEADLENLYAFLEENMQEYQPRLQELKELLSVLNNSNKSDDISPNIFDFATSELSQDAMIAWLISWADPKFSKEDRSLNQVAQSLLKHLLGQPDNFEIVSVEVGRQWKNIDVWAEVNDDLFLIVEDKTNTCLHGNQLERYRASANEYYKSQREVVCSYVKSGNDSLKTTNQLRNNGFVVLERKDILDCLTQYRGENAIARQFISYLCVLEDETNSFMHKPLKEWKWRAWEGFYRELERNLNIDDWSYVANQSGGFLGIWWNWVDLGDGVRMYLQIEEPQKLCIKIEYLGDRKNSSEIRGKYHDLLFAKARELHINDLHNPVRFGVGKYMTIGVVDLDKVINETKINLTDTLVQLRIYEDLVRHCKE